MSICISICTCLYIFVYTWVYYICTSGYSIMDIQRYIGHRLHQTLYEISICISPWTNVSLLSLPNPFSPHNLIYNTHTKPHATLIILSKLHFIYYLPIPIPLTTLPYHKYSISQTKLHHFNQPNYHPSLKTPPKFDPTRFQKSVFLKLRLYMIHWFTSRGGSYFKRNSL